MMAAQESKFAEVADSARRRTTELLQAEIARNDAARQNSLATLVRPHWHTAQLCASPARQPLPPAMIR
jgi:hypothetical protein